MLRPEERWTPPRRGHGDWARRTRDRPPRSGGYIAGNASLFFQDLRQTVIFDKLTFV